MLNWKLDLRLLAFIQIFISLLMGVPTALSFYYQETEAQTGFLIAYLSVAIFCSLVFILVKKPLKKTMLARDGYLVVSITWIMATAFSAIPLAASGAFVDYS
ncbi:MAG: TrkH family potassium uptake protein, partial [Spirochaetia bacterium]|nr:TrkH family potassium uptake protein [Spirochaetia bacterium]